MSISSTLRKMQRERKRIQEQREDVLSPEDRQLTLHNAKNRLSMNLDQLEEFRSFQLRLFLQNLNAWMGRFSGKPPTRPVAIPRDTQDAKIYRRWAWAGIVIEAGLGSWVVSTIWGLPWIVGALISLLTGFFAYVIILAPIQSSKVTRNTVRKIKRSVFWPSVAVFIPSFGIFLAGRIFTGSILIVLLPVFEFALWATTLSLLTLVGSLFTLSHVVDWSARDQAEYIRLEEEQIETTILLAAVNAELDEDKASPNGSIASSPPPAPIPVVTAASAGGDHE